uniref:Uncharacterized protein n=1 Tax=Parascaris univalens TaxID=6257 RepID=A0A915AKD3_PARUN
MPKSIYFMLSSIFFRKCLLLLILPSKIRLDIAPYSAPTSSAFVKIAEHRTTDTITKEAEKRGHWDAKTTRGLDITIDVQPNDECVSALSRLNNLRIGDINM